MSESDPKVATPFNWTLSEEAKRDIDVIEGHAAATLPAQFHPSVDLTGTVSDIPITELLRRAIGSARDPNTRGWHPRWVAVMHTFALGSTYAARLCRQHGFNPDERVKR